MDFIIYLSTQFLSQPLQAGWLVYTRLGLPTHQLSLWFAHSIIDGSIQCTRYLPHNNTLHQKKCCFIINGCIRSPVVSEPHEAV